jgi:predicted nucleic acid-binding protein
MPRCATTGRHLPRGTVKRQTGRAPPVIDTMVAAMAIGQDLSLVTRNVRHVHQSGMTYLNQWERNGAGT